MPVSFDFLNGIAGATGSGDDLAPVFFDDVDGVGGIQTVTFTISTNSIGGEERVAFGVTSPGLNVSYLFLDDRDAVDGGTGDIWTLTFQDTAVTANTQLSGTASNRVEFNVRFFQGTIQYSYITAGGSTIAGGTVTATGPVAAPSALDGVGITGIRLSESTAGSDAIRIDLLSANALNCFAAGTRIATPKGAVAVEDICAGDQVLTADGRAVEVRWLGHQFVDTRVTHPAKVNPICISAGALAEGVPERDLFVSPDHAIEIDGLLINAGVLVNGSSIYQVRHMPREGFTYYHIETNAHELLLAEGCPAESFLCYSDTFGFDNAGERVDQVIPEMSLARVSSPRLLPDTIAARLKERVETLRTRCRAV